MEIPLHPSEQERYHLKGRMPLPYRAMGIIDTGAEKTCVVVQDIGKGCVKT